MSDTFIPKMTDIQAGMENPKVATLNKEFLISKDALYDYYSTNSGMIAKNPSIGGAGGGGGGGDDDPTGLASRVQSIEDKQAAQSVAAQQSIEMLNNNISGIIPEEKITEVDDIIHNQNVLENSQRNILNSI